MKFGLNLLTNERKEAANGLTDFVCPCCKVALIPKCGNLKINHWAHKNIKFCDNWWESETIWHREWKNKFPSLWQENIKYDVNSGEKHIADVYNPYFDLVIEFQNSPISLDEVNSREIFYKKMIWVLNGTKLKFTYSPFTEIDYDLEQNFINRIKRKGKKKFEIIDSKIQAAIDDCQKEINRIEDHFQGQITEWESLQKKMNLQERLFNLYRYGVDKLQSYIDLEYDGYENELELAQELKNNTTNNICLYNWNYKNQIWNNSSKEIFIDLGKTLMLLKGEYIAEEVSYENFIKHYSKAYP